MTSTTIAIPMRLGAALNARVHWTARAKRTKMERAIVSVALRHHPFTADAVPTTCTLVRIAPRALDDDNLAGAFKSIRDEIAAFFEVDDGPKGPIAWRYAQRKSAPKQYGIEISLQWEDV